MPLRPCTQVDSPAILSTWANLPGGRTAHGEPTPDTGFASLSSCSIRARTCCSVRFTGRTALNPCLFVHTLYGTGYVGATLCPFLKTATAVLFAASGNGRSAFRSSTVRGRRRSSALMLNRLTPSDEGD